MDFPVSERIEKITAMRAVIANESAWCAGLRGKDAFGNGVDATNPDAVQHCILGALEVALDGDDEDSPLGEVIVEDLSRFIDPIFIPPETDGPRQWHLAVHNNQLGHARTLKLIDDTLAHLQTLA